jgi:hypothetical protein
MAAHTGLGRMARTLALLVVALVAFAGRAHAQGTFGQLPDPISGPEMTKLSRLYVQPTPQQEESIEALHDSYKERFKVLREGDIERFLRDMQKLQGSGMLPSKEDFDSYLRGYERVQRQVEDLDNSLFEGIVALVGEDRRPAVQRARDARARTRSTMGMTAGMFGQSPNADLSEVILEVVKDPAARAAVDPALVVYEQRLTSLTRDLHESAIEGSKKMIEALRAAGLGEMTQEEMMKNPEKMQEIMEAVQRAMAEAMSGVVRKAGDMKEYSGSTLRTLLPQLPEMDRRRVRHLYISRAHPEIGGDPNGVERIFLWARRTAGLDNQAKALAEEAYRTWVSSDDALVDQALKAAEASRPPMDFTGASEEAQALTTKLREIAEKRATAAARAVDSIRTVLGEERAKRVLEALTSLSNDPFEDQSDPLADAGEGSGSVGIGASASPIEPPSAMERMGNMDGSMIELAAIEQAADCVGLEEYKRVIARTIHADYAKRWNDELLPMRERAAEAARSRWTFGANGSAEEKPGGADAYFQARRDALTKQGELDDRCLQDLAAGLGEPGQPLVALVTLERVEACRRFNRVNDFRAFGVNESQVNFGSLICDASLSAEERSAAVGAAALHAAELLKQARLAQATGLDLEREQEALWRTYQADAARDSAEEGEGEAAARTPSPEAAMRVQREQQRIAARQAAVARTVASAETALWNAVLGAVPEQRRTELADARERARFPGIFDNPRSAQVYLDKALQLSDLADDQRPKVQALADRYRTDHMALCRRMIPSADELAAEPPTSEDMREMQAYWQKQMEIANRREKLRFERDELSQRTVAQLRRLLNEVQVARIEGLSTYEKAFENSRAGPFGQVE